MGADEEPSDVACGPQAALLQQLSHVNPQPMSMMEAERATAVRSISVRDVSRCAQYQLTDSGALVV